MKASEVLTLLNITRPTLCSYVKNGTLKVSRLGNGYYDYDKESVYKFLNKDEIHKYNVIYCRVSTHKQKNDLANQVLSLVEYCNDKDIKIDKIFQETASGIDFERKEFSKLINEVINGKINNIYITYKDRISRLSFITLESMFKKFGTNIIPIHNKDHGNIEEDLFEELINIIHLFSTKIYSKRRKEIINQCIDNLNCK